MSDGLRPLAAVAGAHAEQSARAHGDALAAQARAELAREDAIERGRDADARLAAAALDGGTTAAERVMNDARRARLRERAHAAKLLLDAAEAALERAVQAVEQTRSSLGRAHGDRRVVEAALDRADMSVRAARMKKEDDEADEIAQRAGPR